MVRRFSDKLDKSKIEALVKTGHAKEAQAMLFQKMDATIGGSAAAAAKANPFKVMMNQLEPLMDKIGGAINKVIVAVMPIASMLLDVFSDLLDVIDNHKNPQKTIKRIHRSTFPFLLP